MIEMLKRLLNNKKCIILAAIFIVIDVFVFNSTVSNSDYNRLRLQTVITADENFEFQVFYDENGIYVEDRSVIETVNTGDNNINVEVPVDENTDNLRLDLGYGGDTVVIHSVDVIIGAETINIDLSELLDSKKQNDLSAKLEDSSTLVIRTTGVDPYIALNIISNDSIDRCLDGIKIRNIICAILYCIIADLFATLVLVYFFGRTIQSETDRKKLYLEQKVLVLIVFLICLCGGIMFSTKYCPDEYARFILTDYIFKTGTLPKGYEQEVMIPGWGFSYALRPYLTSLVGAFFMKVASVVTDNAIVLITMSRMPSIIATACTCYFCLKTGNEIFKKRIATFTFAAITCFVPQVMFLGMYLNNDSLSLTAVTMGVFFLVRGHKQHWDKKSCIGLAASFALCLVSYYTVCLWGVFACGYCIISCVMDKTIENRLLFIIKRTVMIAVITVCFSGFFFVRNALLHNGDFLGIASEELSRQSLIEQGQTLVPYDPGLNNYSSIFEMLFQDGAGWSFVTLRSLIACFGYLNIPISDVQYGEYYAMIAFSSIAFLFILIFKKHNMLSYLIFVNLALSSASVVILSVIQSYYRDYQAQGRYIIIVVLLIGFIFGMMADNTSILIDESNVRLSSKKYLMRDIVAVAMVVLWIIQFLRIWFEYMTMMII